MKLSEMFAADASTAEEAYNAITKGLLNVSDVKSCVEFELASQWGITSTLQCFAPFEPPSQEP